MATTTANRTHLISLDWILLAVLGLGGMASAWGLQLVQGMEVTGLGQRVVWGLYVAGFFGAMGAGAALVVLAAASEVSGLVPIAKRRNALILALVSFMVAGLLITMDVGNPINLWRILTARRWSSMMTLDCWFLLATSLLTLVYLSQCWSQPASTNRTRTLGAAAAISGVGLVIVEGWMLSTLVARPLWQGEFTVVGLMIGAATAGLALAILVWPELGPTLGRWLALAIALTLALTLLQMLTGLVAQGVPPQGDIRRLLDGSLGLLFWTYVFGGLGVPLVLLLGRKQERLARIAAGLALAGVVVDKLWLLAAGQAVPWLSMPEGSYLPTWVELLGLAGCVSLGALIFRFASQVIVPNPGRDYQTHCSG